MSTLFFLAVCFILGVLAIITIAAAILGSRVTAHKAQPMQHKILVVTSHHEYWLNQ